MRAGSKRLLAIIFSALGAFFTVLFVLASWVWTQALDTDTYVATSAVAIDQVQIQSEIAQNIVDSVVGEAVIDDNIRAILEQGARLVVSSDEFHSFWELANRGMHEILRNQFLNNDAQLQNAQIDITPEVNQVLTNLRAIDPALSRLLPESAPSTVIEIADTDTVNNIKSAVSGLDRVKVLAPIFAAVFFSLAFLSLGLRRRSVLAPVIALVVAAAVVYALDGITTAIARRFIDSEFRDTADAVLEHMTSSLSSRAWQIVAIAILVVVIAFFPIRIFTNRENTSTD